MLLDFGTLRSSLFIFLAFGTFKSYPVIFLDFDLLDVPCPAPSRSVLEPSPVLTVDGNDRALLFKFIIILYSFDQVPLLLLALITTLFSQHPLYTMLMC